ncbi:hypothetical protein GR11A_00174 [Vibrio phage vB_VcorM_GR11A]|nr:hypothetical protein GR11A_00174 [Vibrio phage vB_VcorM_GR11A]
MGVSQKDTITTMNIFIISKCPERAAQMCCDQHIIKMPVESLQMASVAQHQVGTWTKVLYKPTAHVNHPCTIWVRSGTFNYEWLMRFVSACQEEYRYRFGDKPRKVDEVYSAIKKYIDIDVERTPFVAAISKPDKIYELWTWSDAYDRGDVTITRAYREFYIQDKSRWARWTRREPPKWYVKGLLRYRLMHRLRYRSSSKLSWSDAEFLDMDHYPEADDNFQYVPAY